MATLVFVRHGETDWNRDHRWQGFTGPPLNETGRCQAAELAAQLENIDAIYSSDTIRAHETAAIVGERLGLPVTSDQRLREVNFGEWEGLTRQEINERFAGAFARWDALELAQPTGGESDGAMSVRVIRAVVEIAGDHSDDQRVLVVTSGGPIRAVQAHVQGIDQRAARGLLVTVKNCSPVEVAVRGETFSDPTDDHFANPS